ncbi:MAG: CRISPR-associated endonuclease Cas3'' [Gemmatimonadota bacterium]
MSQSEAITERPERDLVYAHTLPNSPEADWEPLRQHLEDVAGSTATFADAFGAREWGEVAGLWHDLGKYRPAFQRRLRGSGERVDHAIVGALLAWERRLPALAFVIAGHHAGLANLTLTTSGGPGPLRERMRRESGALVEALPHAPERLHERAAPELPNELRPSPTVTQDTLARRSEMWTRFLFSALVDADYLATEAFLDPRRQAARRQFSAIPQLRRRLDSRLARFRVQNHVDEVRARVLADCRVAAERPPGFFSLTVPTGGGKTLSSMAFALAHAERHGLRRVIVVAPFTSIIDQNAAVYEDAFGAENVIQHHSGIDPIVATDEDGERERRRRLAAENWDATVIVTTAVQFFESLFANHPSRCRKLHNVAQSVVILDEAQTLPADFLDPVLGALRQLRDGFGCSLVLSTATQPALEKRVALPRGLEGVEEIVKDVPGAFRALVRIRAHWPEPGAPPTPYAELADRVRSHDQVLAIVHLRQDARTLAELVGGEHLFHLSALMCAAHRTHVLAQVRARLKARESCKLVATQLVEAGVDVDFPVVYRALAGLDSLAQAAGRCNRNGNLPFGDFHVFLAETMPPPGNLSIGFKAAQALLSEFGLDLPFLEPEVQQRYFRAFYLGATLDKKGVQGQRAALNFAQVAHLVRLIEDGYSRPVVVPWGQSAARIEAYRNEPHRETRRALQAFTVQVHERHIEGLFRAGAVEELDADVWTITPPFRHLYDQRFGLLAKEPGQADPEALMIGL